MTDVVTPLTFERDTVNCKGSIEGWMAALQTGMDELRNTLPGLANFWTYGHGVQPGGGLLPAALSDGKPVQLLCARDSRKFITSVP